MWVNGSLELDLARVWGWDGQTPKGRRRRCTWVSLLSLALPPFFESLSQLPAIHPLRIPRYSQRLVFIDLGVPGVKARHLVGVQDATRLYLYRLPISSLTVGYPPSPPLSPSFPPLPLSYHRCQIL